jgi:endonuclease V-like protein UPF0215 family
MKWGRVVGVDDGYFERNKDKLAPLVATIMKKDIIEGFRFGWVSIDGTDATESILDLISDLKDQVSALFLYGTIFGGTNVVSLNDLHETLKRPVVAVVDEKPSEYLVRKALRIYGSPISLKTYNQNPIMERLDTRRGPIYVSYVGINRGEVLRLVELYQRAGKVPEPLRVSHLIGREMGRWI